MTNVTTGKERVKQMALHTEFFHDFLLSTDLFLFKINIQNFFF